MPTLRQSNLTRPIHRDVRKALSCLSETKAAAIDARRPGCRADDHFGVSWLISSHSLAAAVTVMVLNSLDPGRRLLPAGIGKRQRRSPG